MTMAATALILLLAGLVAGDLVVNFKLRRNATTMAIADSVIAASVLNASASQLNGVYAALTNDTAPIVAMSVASGNTTFTQAPSAAPATPVPHYAFRGLVVDFVIRRNSSTAALTDEFIMAFINNITAQLLSATYGQLTGDTTELITLVDVSLKPTTPVPSSTPTTQAPATPVPSTSTKAPTTNVPTSRVPVTTYVPPSTEPVAPTTSTTTRTPITLAPITKTPTTNVPSTAKPTTRAPTTTHAPTTAAPTTAVPITPPPVVSCPSYDGTDASLLTTAVPWRCSSFASCLTKYCSCANGVLNTTTAQCTDEGLATVDSYASCTEQKLRCLISNANTLVAAPTSEMGNACLTYATALIGDYQSHYTAPEKTSTVLYKSCAAVMCNNAMQLFQAVVRYDTVCQFSGLALPMTAPPVTPAPVKMTCPSTDWTNLFYDALPLQCSKSLKACISSFCSCIGGNYTVDGICQTSSASLKSTQEASNCAQTSAKCVLSTALGMYTPLTDVSSGDVCVAWPAKIAQAYQAFYLATAADRPTTTLATGCKASLCTLLTNYYFGTIDYSTGCAFSGVTSTPLYKEPYLFRCPDGNNRTSVALCPCLATVQAADAIISPAISGATVDPRNSLAVNAYVAYRVPSGPCSTTSFDKYLSYEWTLQDDTSKIVATSKSNTINVPPLGMIAGRRHFLTLFVTGFNDSTTSYSYNFTVKSPDPLMQFKMGERARISSVQNAVVVATITDVDPTYAKQNVSLSSSWSCTPPAAGTCPTLTPRISSQSDQSALTFASGAAAGDYVVTLTYRQSFTKSIKLTVLEYSVPVARVLITSGALVDSPTTYLSTQKIYFLAKYSDFADSVVFSWYVNNALMPAQNGTNFGLAASTLVPTSSSDYSAKRFTYNNVTVRIASAQFPDKFGESSTQIVVLAQFTASLTASCVACAVGFDPVALQDTISFSVTPLSISSTLSAIGIPYQFVVSYWDSSRLKYSPLTLTQTAGQTFTAIAPMLKSDGAVSFVATLKVNGLLSASSDAVNVTVVLPNAQDAAASQVSQVQNIKDPSAAVEAVSNLRSLMESGKVTEAQKAEMAAVVVNVLANTIASSANALTAEQQSQLCDTLSSSLASQTDESQKKAMGEKVSGMMSAMINSPTFDVSKADTVLSTLSNFDPSNVADAMTNLAIAMAKDPNQPVGEPKSISSGNLSITTVKNTPSTLGGSKMSAGNTSVSIPVGTDMVPGVDPDTIVGLATTSSSTSTLTSNDNSQPANGVVTIDLTLNGKSSSVSGMAKKVGISFPSTPSSRRRLAKGNTDVTCKYYDATSSSWKTDGVTTAFNPDGSVSCNTEHFTAFGVFETPIVTPVPSTATPVTPVPLTPAPVPEERLCNDRCVIAAVVATVGGCSLIVTVVVVIVKRLKTTSNNKQQEIEVSDEKGNSHPHEPTATSV